MKINFQKTPVKRVAIAAFCAVATVLAMPANAQYYGGIALNSWSLTGVAIGHDDVGGAAHDSGFSTPLVALRNAHTRYGLKFSYPLAANLAIEGRYSELLRANYGAFTLPGNSNSFSAAPREARNYALDLVATAPLFERVSVFGRVGIQSLRTDNAFAIPTSIDLTPLAPGQSNTAARLGLGVRYDFSNSLGLRLEAERFRKISGSALGDTSLDNYSFGIMLKF